MRSLLMHLCQQLVWLAKDLKRAGNDMMCFQKFLNRRSFLINPANVVRLDKKEKLLFFPNGGSCMIARYKVREVSGDYQ